MSIDLTFGFEKTGFVGYTSYERDGGYDDADFEVLGKGGIGTNTKIEIRKLIYGMNAVSLGLGITFFQYRANSISGWMGEILDSKNVLIPSLCLQLGHIFNVKSDGNFNVSLKNNLALMKNTKFSEYYLKEINLIWRPGIYLEKTISMRNSLIFEINYGLGLLRLSENDRYELRNNALGLNLGIRRQL
ncbi:MAG: hypothetical protein V3V14_08700 [Saprospiraceae bacterium]